LDEAERVASGAAPPLVSAVVRYATPQDAAATLASINRGMALMGQVVRARLLSGGEEASYRRLVEARREAYAAAKRGAAPAGRKRPLPQGAAGGAQGRDAHGAAASASASASAASAARPEKRSRLG
jgi:hypothetical protein